MVPFLAWHGAYVAHHYGACFACYRKAQRAAQREAPLHEKSTDAEFRHWQSTVETMAVFFHSKETGELPDGTAIVGKTMVYM